MASHDHKTRSITYPDGVTVSSADARNRGTREYWGHRKHWGRTAAGNLVLLDGPDPIEVANLPERALADLLPQTAETLREAGLT